MNRIHFRSLHCTRCEVSVLALMAGACLIFGASSSHAGIAGITADGELIAPPASVQAGDLENDTKIRIFEEKSTFVLPSDVAVDILGVGIADMTNRNTPPPPGVIPAGTRVDVFFIHHDSVAEAFNALVTQISTDSNILGLIHSDDLLDATDGLLGAAGTLYPTGLELRGMVVHPTEGNNEFVEVANTPNGPRLVRSNSLVEQVIDQVRVITVAAVPEPATTWLCLWGSTAWLICAGCREQRYR